MQARRLIPCTVFLLLATASAGAREEGDAAPAADAESIMQQVYAVYGGDDTFARLHFHFEFDRGKTSQTSLVMGFKRDGAGPDAGYRVIMFGEQPPDRKDIGFLGVFHPPAEGREDEMWLYLPDLRSTRRLTHAHSPQAAHEGHDHGGHARHEGVSDEFSVSLLNHEELMPRWPALDRHSLLPPGEIDGKSVWRIESVPRDPVTSAYERRIQWIDREHALLLRTEYFSDNGRKVRTQDQHWRRHGEAWLWERVVAVDHASGDRTVLEQRDVQVNLGLTDELFSRRILTRGGASFETRVARIRR